MHCLLIPTTHEELWQQLYDVGIAYQNCGISQDFYDILFKSFDYILEKTFCKSSQAYDVQVKFCFSRFFHILIDIMQQNCEKSRIIRQAKERGIIQDIEIIGTTTHVHPEVLQIKALSLGEAERNCTIPITSPALDDSGKCKSVDSNQSGMNSRDRSASAPPNVRAQEEMFVGQNIDIENENNIPNANESLTLKIETFLHSLEDCLSDEFGFELFEKFCNEHLCNELILFYKEYVKYKNALNQINRNKIGSKIITKFIMDSAGMLHCIIFI